MWLVDRLVHVCVLDFSFKFICFIATFVSDCRPVLCGLWMAMNTIQEDLSTDELKKVRSFGKPA